MTQVMTECSLQEALDAIENVRKDVPVPTALDKRDGQLVLVDLQTGKGIFSVQYGVKGEVWE